MSTIAYQRNLVMYLNADFCLTITDLPTAWDLTGATAKLEIKDAGGTLLSSFTDGSGTAVDDVGRTITVAKAQVTIAAELTADGFYDLVLTMPAMPIGEQNKRLLEGTITRSVGQTTLP